MNRHDIFGDPIEISMADAVFETRDGLTLCDGGISHLWVLVSGDRICPTGVHSKCRAPVFRCRMCGEFDDGKAGGPAHRECAQRCIFRDINPTVSRQMTRQMERLHEKSGEWPMPQRSPALEQRAYIEQLEKMRRNNVRMER